MFIACMLGFLYRVVLCSAHSFINYHHMFFLIMYTIICNWFLVSCVLVVVLDNRKRTEQKSRSQQQLQLLRMFLMCFMYIYLMHFGICECVWACILCLYNMNIHYYKLVFARGSTNRKDCASNWICLCEANICVCRQLRWGFIRALRIWTISNQQQQHAIVNLAPPRTAHRKVPP